MDVSSEQPSAQNDTASSNAADRIADEDIVSMHSSVSDDESCPTACCNPRRTHYRFIALFFMCFLGFGSYFCYDTPSSLQNQIKEDMEVTTFQFTSLYALYSWPNVILCFVGGFLIDRVFGIRLGTLIFSTIVTVGHFTYAIGALVNAFWLMQTGRFIFGVGGESLAVAQNTYVVSWFKGKELNFVFGLQLSMARLGSTFNFLSMEAVYSWVDTFADGNVALGLALIVAGFTCIFSLMCAIILALLDLRRSRALAVSAAEAGDKIQLKDILYFPLSFWLISIICVTYYAAIFPFIAVAKVFFMYKYGLADSQANLVSSIVYLISAVMSPLFGAIVDKTGRNVMWVGIAVFCTIISHGMLAFTFINPFVPMSLMGLSYSLLASSLWPMVSLILPESQLGTGYGIMQSIQNLGLALISMLSGYIIDHAGYLLVEVLNIICLSIALGSVGVIYVTDAYFDEGYLMKPSSSRPKESPRVKKILLKQGRGDQNKPDKEKEATKDLESSKEFSRSSSVSSNKSGGNIELSEKSLSKTVIKQVNDSTGEQTSTVKDLPSDGEIDHKESDSVSSEPSESTAKEVTSNNESKTNKKISVGGEAGEDNPTFKKEESDDGSQSSKL